MKPAFPCKDCICFASCLSYISSQIVLNNAVLYIAIHRCSLLYEYIYIFYHRSNGDLEAEINKEHYTNAVNYYYDFIFITDEDKQKDNGFAKCMY